MRFMLDKLALEQVFFSDFSCHCHSISASHSSFVKQQTDKPWELSSSSGIHSEIAKQKTQIYNYVSFFMIQIFNIFLMRTNYYKALR
jgi:hypothetical protein